MGGFIVGLVLIAVGVGLFFAKSVNLKTNTGLRHQPVRRAAPVPAAIGLLLVLASVVRVVGATDVGIPVAFGKIGKPLSPGIHLVPPWTVIQRFSTRLQESNMTQVPAEGDRSTPDGVEVLSSEGGRMVIDLTVRYRVDDAKASALYRLVGSMDGIRERIVRPDTRGLIRDVYSRYTAEESYSTKRELISGIAQDELTKRLQPRGIVLDALRVRDIRLEDKLQAQITAKLEARQLADRAKIEQTRAQTEAETRRKVAETDAQAKIVAAKGDAEANAIVSASLTPALLRSKEIEAIRTNPNTVLYPFGQPISPFVSSGPRSPVATTPAPPADDVPTPSQTTEGDASH